MITFISGKILKGTREQRELLSRVVPLVVALHCETPSLLLSVSYTSHRPADSLPASLSFPVVFSGHDKPTTPEGTEKASSRVGLSGSTTAALLRPKSSQIVLVPQSLILFP